MKPIDTTTSGLAAIIRRQVGSLARTSGGASAKASGRRPARAGSPAAAEASSDIAALIARRVQAIDPDDPERQKKAFKVFLESVLLAEFGEGLINDAGFHQLVDDVHGDMQRDHDLAAAVRAATARLLALAPSASPPPPRR